MTTQSNYTNGENCRPYVYEDKMRDLVFYNPELLPALTRFGISLGFGESTVKDVCAHHDVDVSTFLAVCNFISGRDNEGPGIIKIKPLLNYLRSAHRYFLDYLLPGIRTRLISAISTGTPGDFTFMFIAMFDEYINEVRNHMDYEDLNVFGYVEELTQGRRDMAYSIDKFSQSHLTIDEKLRDIKELFVGHYTALNGRVDMLNSVLYDIIMCERDITHHCRLEDKLFVPAVKRLEDKVETEERHDENSEPTLATDTDIDENGDIVLTARERDIVAGIASGLSNKEIAAKFFLSVHTVTTHRRNICAKLNIHSAPGITIYALMHGLITFEEARRAVR